MSYFLVVTAFDRRDPDPNVILNDSPLRHCVIFMPRQLRFAHDNGGGALMITRHCLDPNLLRISCVRDRDSFAKAVLPKVCCDFRKEGFVRRWDRCCRELIRKEIDLPLQAAVVSVWKYATSTEPLHATGIFV